ncbi:MAG: AhpC/TSA family protein [Bacteroidia bacterium]|nr:AhpC/TSA family protein [Bacteroidia bacterium]MCC7532687.1 AhpC/TSA family protein [Bacteroidia bacterium]
MTKIKANYSWFLLLFIFLVSCSVQEAEHTGFVVKGKIQNLENNKISIQEITPKGLLFLDSATVAPDGSFEMKGNVSERIFCVIQVKDDAIVLVLDSLTEIIVNVDANNPQNYTVTGSNESEKLKNLLLLNSKYMDNVKALEAKYSIYQDEVPPLAVQEKIRLEYDSLMSARKSDIQQLALQFDNSIVPYFATNYLLPDASFEFLKEIDNKYYSEFAKSKYAIELHKRIDILAKTAIGSVAPDIVLQDPFGKTTSLSGLRGKVVLIDFWASWCKPCREENPNVVKAYNKFKGRGFEVFGVSLDDNRDAWIKAINDDKLLWTQVSDLMKWNSSVVSLYNIEGIPFTVLIDGEGKIIAKNLRGKALDDKLTEILK